MASQGVQFDFGKPGDPKEPGKGARFFIWVKAEMSELELVSGFLREALAREAAYPENPDERYLVELAVMEACTNIIRYAYRASPSGKLGVAVKRRGTRLEILTLDQGEPFDPTRVPPPDLTTPKEGGYGIFLIRKLMTELRYIRKGSRWNCLFLVRDDQKGCSSLPEEADSPASRLAQVRRGPSR